MEKLKEFEVELALMQAEHCEKDYRIDKSFFESMENDSILGADVDVLVDIDKRHGSYEVEIHCEARGTWQPAARNSRAIFSKLAAYALVWAVRRIISHPASASSKASFTQASVSRVSDVSMDWIRMGLEPPTPTFPTMTSRVTRRVYR